MSKASNTLALVTIVGLSLLLIRANTRNTMLRTTIAQCLLIGGQ